MTPRLSVVIPTLNEAEDLPGLLADLKNQQGVTLDVIVADGGSGDATVEQARSRGARVVVSNAGRGLQMNQGARAANSDYLLFLHADSRLADPQLLVTAVQALDRSDSLAGHFALRFRRQLAGHEAFFRRLEAKTRLNRRDAIHGDQGLLIRAADFWALGGFDTRLPFLEDWRMAQKISDRAGWLQLPGELQTSARRFEVEGHLPRYLLMGLIVAMHEAGAMAFFDDSRALYAEQRQPGQLVLRPWQRAARRAMLAGGPARLLQRHWRLGRFILRQAWQWALAWDLARGQAVDAMPGPALRRYQRWLEPVLQSAWLAPLWVPPAVLIGAVMIYSPWYWRRGLGELGRLPPEA